jgi:imidazole glycerol-phosphate synthase subunit HisH
VIALIDYGSGNLRSVEKALLKVGADVHIVTRPEKLSDFHGIVLPGVGAFDDCLNALHKQELLQEIRVQIQQGKPFLGICVGYQALFEKSDEFNSCAVGLGIFRGKVRRFAGSQGQKVPQIGWNQLHLKQPHSPFFFGIEEGSYVYFVHSFFPEPEDPSIVASETEYGETFASAIAWNNVYATQFHPEKSQEVGLRLLKNFSNLAEVSS